jgi:hypothetical protein
MASRRKRKPITRKQEVKVAKRTKQYDDDDDDDDEIESRKEQRKGREVIEPPPTEIACPRMTWKGKQQVKRWRDAGVCIDFAKGEPVSLAHLSPYTVEGMRRNVEGRDEWMLELRPE